jgi:hypothetical protein
MTSLAFQAINVQKDVQVDFGRGTHHFDILLVVRLPKYPRLGHLIILQCPKRPNRFLGLSRAAGGLDGTGDLVGGTRAVGNERRKSRL